jgi:hypothetical protein
MKRSFNLKKISLVILLFALTAINAAKLSPELGGVVPIDKTEAAVVVDASTTGADVTTTSTSSTIFVKLDFKAIDIGCGSEGDICAVGIDSALYCYDFMANNWILFPTELSDISRVDVDDDGTVYIIAECGIYYLDCYYRWNKLPGRGKDIGVGVNFDVYKIGLDEHICDKKTNYGVWKLICDCPCKCDCTRPCMRFRFQKLDFCLPNEVRKCFWFRVDGWGVSIDVFPNGEAVVVQANGDVHLVDYLGTFRSLDNKFIALDVTVGNNGVIYASATDGTIYKRLDSSSNTKWDKIKELTKLDAGRLCASAYDQIWYINTKNDHVYTGSRYNYVD